MGSQRLPGQPERFGSPGAILRRIERLNQDLRELGPSIAKSFAGTVADLQAQQAALGAAQQDIEAAQQDLAAQQQDLSALLARQVETNQVYTRVIGVSTNDSGFFPAILLNKPTWANAALVTGSMIYETGSTTREALLVTTLGPDYPGPQISNYFVSSEFAVVQEASQPAVATDFLGDTLRIDTYRNSMASGTGTLAVRQFINVTWVFDANISPLSEPPPASPPPPESESESEPNPEIEEL